MARKSQVNIDDGLNRTKVGLKLSQYFHSISKRIKFESNQGGIETSRLECSAHYRGAFESNQGGIETDRPE